MSDPVFHEDKEWHYAYGDEVLPPGWYFWDEVGLLGGGPYATEQECRERLSAYGKSLMGGEEPQPQASIGSLEKDKL